MLTPGQIDALRDIAGSIADPINDYLVKDIARRVAEAGQLTSTAAYQIYRAQQLGLSRKEIKRRLAKELSVGTEEINRLLTQSAEVGYNFDISQFSQAAVSFAKNESIQQIVATAVILAQEDFVNLTQTLGMVDPSGIVQPLQTVYQKTMDYAFEQVFTGAADYNTAIRQTVKNIANYGVRVIDYESGVHTSLEAAVRRNIMGGLGLMQEQITQANHDELGANGWEISAHAASAPDHEPIQGKQYTDAEYKALNNSLVRRIGTLNCGHAAFPIILGVNSPQYTSQQLEQLRRNNVRGVSYEGRTYTLYEATQKQRQIERAIRQEKNRVLTAQATGDQEQKLTSQIRLQRLNQEYARFSKAVGLPTQRERMQIAGFGKRGAVEIRGAAKKSLLPKRKVAIIHVEKFTGYVLNPQKDPDKAFAFMSALGYDINNTDALISNIRANLSGFPAIDKGDKGYGKLYEVRMDLTGPNGKNAKVITAWIDDKRTGEMRLVSAYVDKKKGGAK